MRLRHAVVATALVLGLTSCSGGTNPDVTVAQSSLEAESGGDASPDVTDTLPPDESTTTTTDPVPVPIVIDAAGDIACAPGSRVKPTACQQEAVANAMINPDWVIPLGDLQYPTATATTMKAYRDSWGIWDQIALPVVGNHEYKTTGAVGYYNYWAQQGKNLSKGFQVYNVGNGWTFISVNSVCNVVNCITEAAALDAYFANHFSTCVIVGMHHPRYSSGQHGTTANKGVIALWQVFVKHQVPLVLSGHEHSYERRKPVGQTVQVIVGTGGGPVDPITPPDAGTVRQIDATFGFLRLSLLPGVWTSEYQSVLPTKDVLDRSAGTCG